MAATEAFSQTIPFTIYFSTCAYAVIVPVNDFSITDQLVVGTPVTYTDTAIGFESSDPTNCPLGDAAGITATYIFCTDNSFPCSIANSFLTNYWTISTNTLSV